MLGFSAHAPQSFRPSRVFGEVEAESFDAVKAEVKAGETGDVWESVEVEDVVVRKVHITKFLQALEIASVEHGQFVVREISKKIT